MGEHGEMKKEKKNKLKEYVEEVRAIKVSKYRDEYKYRDGDFRAEFWGQFLDKMLVYSAKVSSFRKDMYKAERKALKDIWQGDDLNVANVARFSPSACNSQPWFVENKDNQLYVYRKSKSGRVGIMTDKTSKFFNQIDIGIFMCILEICLLNEGYSFDRTLQKDNEALDTKVLNAIYKYKKV